MDSNVIEISDSDSEKSSQTNDCDIEFNDTILPAIQNVDNDDFMNNWDLDEDDRPAIDYDASFEREVQPVISATNDSENSSNETVLYDSEAMVERLSQGGCSQETDNTMKKVRKKGNKEEIERRKLERMKEKNEKKDAQMRQKAVKAAMAEKQRAMKPEESIKSMKVHLDNGVINSVCGGTVISTLQQAEIQYVVEAQITPSTVYWSKQRKDKVMNEDGELVDKYETNEENCVVWLVDWSKAVTLVHSKELLSQAMGIKSQCHDKLLTICIYGLEKYFAYQKVKRNREVKSAVRGTKTAKPKHYELEFEHAPLITRNQLEFSLTELQLMGRCNHRAVESAEDFASLILQFTKSLAQVEFKQQQYGRQDDQLEWYARADSKNCVRVDKEGRGLARLWEQQVTQFSGVGIETAQAISALYPSPLALVRAYDACADAAAAEKLLQDVPVRRNAGVLSSSRRIGPELSRKLHRFFTTDDPEQEL